jgi:putative ABC transport system substrate-binding protein
MIGRREFITLLGGTAASPLAARAQQQALPMIGWLGATSSEGPYAQLAAAFRKGLGEGGYTDGRNVTIEYRWAGGQYDRLPELAVELVQRRVSVIVTSGGTAAIIAARNATATLPIVFNAGSDPVTLRMVESLNRPTSNLTGISNLSAEVQPKKLQLLHELLPSAKVIAFLVNRANASFELQERELQEAAAKLGLRLEILDLSREEEIEPALAVAAQREAAAAFLMSDGFQVSRSEQIIAIALRHRIPVIAGPMEARAGGLLGYGPNLADAYRQSGVYVARILKGEKVADLPIQQVTKLDLVFNLKTATALGISVSPMLLALADEVIE